MSEHETRPMPKACLNNVRSKVVRNALFEAARRFATFSKSNDKWDAFCAGLGTPSEYKDAVKQGYFRHDKPWEKPVPRVDSWYNVTTRGFYVVIEILANYTLREIYSELYGANGESIPDASEVSNTRQLEILNTFNHDGMKFIINREKSLG